MRYALVDVDLDTASNPIELEPGIAGVGLVSRRAGRVVGFSLHATGARTLDPGTVAEMLDPAPVHPPAMDLDPALPAPTISVAVCTRDRPDLLRDCLRSLLDLTDAPDEIIVVDNAPRDRRTADVVTEAGDQVRRVLEPCPGLDVARNAALRHATSDIVAFVDDDVLVDRHWLSSQRAAWQRHPGAGALTGQILPAELDTAAQVAFEARGGFGGGNDEIRWAGMDRDDNPIYPYHPGMFGAGANLAVRRRVALSLGGFDEALDTGPPLAGGGDSDLLHRVIRSGLAVVYEPRAVVFHRHRREQADLRRQYESWGRSLTAWATQRYRDDPGGRPKLRRLLRWFFGTHGRDALLARRSGDRDRGVAASAELRGALSGLAGAYGRSKRRMGRRRRRLGRPQVAILPWGDVYEDYLDPIGLALDDFADTMDGGWLFGYVEALELAGVDTVIICWSARVRRATRRLHVPTGAVLWFLPQPALHRRARGALAEPYPWTRRQAVGAQRGWGAVRASVARELVPYLATGPWSLAGILRREGVRAVLCQEYEEGRFDVCIALGRALRLPVSATFQGGDHTRSRLERLLRPLTVRRAAGLLIGATTEAERVRARYGVDPSAVHEVPNPFDARTMPPASRARARARLGIQPHERTAVWHGRVDVRPKGLDLLVDAWATVRGSARSSVRLLLLGTGSGSDWLHARLTELGGDDVTWRDEYVLDRAVIADHLAAGDVYVLPSRQEGFPVAPVEAMAAGLPVVACDAPGVRAVVGSDGRCGSVVGREDAGGLARELVRYLDSPQLATAAGDHGRRRVATHLSPDRIGTRLRAVLLDE